MASDDAEPRTMREIPDEFRSAFKPEETREINLLFESADDDGNEVIDAVELENLIVREGWLDGSETSSSVLARVVTAVDTNKNGLFEWDEFVAMIARLRRYKPSQVLGTRCARASVSADAPQTFKFRGVAVLDKTLGPCCAVRYTPDPEVNRAPCRCRLAAAEFCTPTNPRLPQHRVRTPVFKSGLGAAPNGMPSTAVSSDAPAFMHRPGMAVLEPVQGRTYRNPQVLPVTATPLHFNGTRRVSTTAL